MGTIMENFYLAFLFEDIWIQEFWVMIIYYFRDEIKSSS